MRRALRLTVFMTHPVQYMAPWFRHIAANRADLELTVLYAALPDPEQQGIGFERPFAWDVPLTEGYRFDVCGDARGQSFDSDRFRGLDVPGIGRCVRDTRPDVVLIPGWHSVVQRRALRECRRMGVPVLYRGDSTLFSGPRGVLRALWAMRTRYKLRLFDGYLSVGTHADTYLRSFGIADPLIVRSPHCVDNERFAADAVRLRSTEGRTCARRRIGASDDDFVVLFAGKFQERKRPLDAVKAVARLGPSAVLMMVGDGSLREACRAEAERLGVRLASTGFLNQTELPSAFAAADCALVPSAWESWGLIVNEALASGVPCVVTAGVACAPDLIVEGETGHAVAAGDTAAIALRLAAVRARIADGHDFGPRCRQQVQTCSFAVAADGLATACRRAVSRRSLQRGRPSVVACCGSMVDVFGMERQTFEVLRGLREHDVPVHCIVNSWGSARIADMATAIGASWGPGHYEAPFRFRGISIGQAARLASDIARVSAVLVGETWRRRATHVLIPDMGAAVWNAPALALLRLAGVVVVMRVGNAPEQSSIYRTLWGRVIDAVVTLFVPNSRFSADALRAVGVPEAKIRIVGNTLPTRPPTVEPSEEVSTHAARIVYVGQLIPAKGCDRLLEAVARVAGRGCDVSLDVVGDTERWEPPAWEGYIAALQARASADDLVGHVRFFGAREDVPAILSGAALHCLPSLLRTREGFGNVTLEAKCAGLPSVVTPSGGVPELVAHQQDGFVCADDSVESLVEGLEYFLRDAAALSAASLRARSSAARFDRSRFVAAWLDVFGVNAPAGADRAAVVHGHAD